jgi:hypothetical protein
VDVKLSAGENPRVQVTEDHMTNQLIILLTFYSYFLSELGLDELLQQGRTLLDHTPRKDMQRLLRESKLKHKLYFCKILSTPATLVG